MVNQQNRKTQLIIQQHDDFEEDLLINFEGKYFTIAMGQSDTKYGDLVIWEGKHINEEEVFGNATIYHHESELWLQGKLIYRYSRIVTMGMSIYLQGIAGIFTTIL